MAIEYSPSQLVVKMVSKRFQSKEHTYLFTSNDGELTVQTPISPPLSYKYCLDTNTWRVRELQLVNILVAVLSLY